MHSPAMLTELKNCRDLWVQMRERFADEGYDTTHLDARIAELEGEIKRLTAAQVVGATDSSRALMMGASARAVEFFNN